MQMCRNEKFAVSRHYTQKSQANFSMMRELRVFFTALQFFTRLPIPLWVGYEPSWVRVSARYFPLIGILVGGVTAAILLFSAQGLPMPLAVLLSTAAGILLTGALHEDGFADFCDGFGGGNTPGKIIEIMRDPRIGAFGAIGIGLLLAIKIVSLASMPAPTAAWALLLAHPLSRIAATTLIWRMRYAAPDGKASFVSQAITLPIFFVACLPIAALLVIALSCDAFVTHSLLIAAGAMLIGTVWLARKFQCHLGGYTGDCLGAVQQVTEVLFYIGLLVQNH